jgi:hypothetical protein
VGSGPDQVHFACMNAMSSLRTPAHCLKFEARCSRRQLAREAMKLRIRTFAARLQKKRPSIPRDLNYWGEPARKEAILPSTDPDGGTSTVDGRMAARIAQSYLPSPEISLHSCVATEQSDHHLLREGSGYGNRFINHVAAGAWWFVERIPS